MFAISWVRVSEVVRRVVQRMRQVQRGDHVRVALFLRHLVRVRDRVRDRVRVRVRDRERVRVRVRDSSG